MSRDLCRRCALYASALLFPFVSPALEGMGSPPSDEARYQELAARPWESFNNVDLADYVNLHHGRIDAAIEESLPPGEDIVRWARRSIRQPFALHSMRHGFESVDCVTWLERCIALGVADSWESYWATLERLRHKDGVLKYVARNAYPLADWVPNNSWLFEDITAQLGVEVSEFQLGVFRKSRLASQVQAGLIEPNDVNLESIPEKELLRQTYIAREALSGCLDRLRPGDIGFVIREKRKSGLAPWCYCDHMVLIARDEAETVTIVHAAPPRVREEPLTTFLANFDHVRGFKFLRLRPQVGQIVSREVESLTQRVQVLIPLQQDQAVEALRAERNTDR